MHYISIGLLELLDLLLFLHLLILELLFEFLSLSLHSLFLSGFLFTRVKTHLVRKSAGSSAAEKLKGIPATLDRLWGALIWFFAGAGCAQVLSVELGFRLKSVLALGGFSSVVVGLACQTPLANVVKGLIIAASGSFGTGDKIASAGMTGVVEDFGCGIARDCT